MAVEQPPYPRYGKVVVTIKLLLFDDLFWPPSLKITPLIKSQKNEIILGINTKINAHLKYIRGLYLNWVVIR